MADDPLSTSRAASPATAPSISVTMHQAYDVTMTVSLAATRDIPSALRRGCQPRQGAERVDADPLDLPAPTRKWLVEVNKAVLAWLAQDESHQHAFLADPVAALARAGVKAEREHLTALSRMRESLGMSQAVPPGLQLRSVRTEMSRNGRVRPADSSTTAWTPPKAQSPDDDCGCDDKHGKGRS